MKKAYFGKGYLTHIFLLLPILTIVAGCSTISYVEKKSGSSSRVRFTTKSDGVTIITTYSSTNCEDRNEMMRLRNGFLFNSSPKRLGIPLWNYHENAAKEFYISSDVPQIYMFELDETFAYTVYRCGVIISQKFEKGKDYELSFTMKHPGCYVDVNEIRKTEEGDFEKVLLQTQDNTLNSNFSKSCITAFKRHRFW